jgi:hypothetical protein
MLDTCLLGTVAHVEWLADMLLLLLLCLAHLKLQICGVTRQTHLRQPAATRQHTHTAAFVQTNTNELDVIAAGTQNKEQNAALGMCVWVDSNYSIYSAHSVSQG